MTLLFLLFNFNGHIVSHLAVGHIMWSGYFLLSLLIYNVLKLIEDDDKYFALKTSFVFSLLLLQGSLHIYIWCCMFFGLMALFDSRYLKPVAASILYSFIISAYRFIPSIITLFSNKLDFISGYPSLAEMFNGFTAIKLVNNIQIKGAFGYLYMWELDNYVGLVGFVYLVYFGIRLRFTNRELLSKYKFKQFDIPLLILAILSYGAIYKLVTILPLPFVSTERVSSRFLIIPVVFLIFISSIRLDGFIKTISRKWIFKLVALFGLGGICWDLLTHLRYWNISNINLCLSEESLYVTKTMKVLNDVFYINVVKASFFISVFAFFCFGYVYIKKSRKDQVR